MKIVLIRHGEPDYTDVTEREFIGHGLDLAHLTVDGKEQAKKTAEDIRLNDIELIVSSPYTRALQTAAIISRYRNVEIAVELNLHEWLPDLTYTFSSEDFAVSASKLCSENKGVCPVNSPMKYEELSTVFKRANDCLQKYLHHKKIAVVAHSILIRQFSFSEKIPYCGISEIDFRKNFKWCGFIEKT